MSQSDPLQALRQDPQAARLLSDPAALRQLLSSPQAQTLANLLQKAGGDSLRAAAASAARGESADLSAIVSQVSADPSGARALTELERQSQI